MSITMCVGQPKGLHPTKITFVGAGFTPAQMSLKSFVGQPQGLHPKMIIFVGAGFTPGQKCP